MRVKECSRVRQQKKGEEKTHDLSILPDHGARVSLTLSIRITTSSSGLGLPPLKA